jgi:hypothetical protein
MSIDCEVDDLRPVNEIIKARLGKRVCSSTLWRWRLKGVNGVRLECVRVGGLWATTAEAFARFLDAQTAALQPADNIAPIAKQKRGRKEAIRG